MNYIITIVTTYPDGTRKLVLQSHVTFWLPSENHLIEPGSCSVETILEWLIKSTEVWQGDNEVKPLLLLKANYTVQFVLYMCFAGKAPFCFFQSRSLIGKTHHSLTPPNFHMELTKLRTKSFLESQFSGSRQIGCANCGIPKLQKLSNISQSFSNYVK